MTIRTSTLACGMPLLTERIAGAGSVSVAWLIPAGSAHDPADRVGVAPMLAELVWRGAGALDSRRQADAFDAIGASRGCDVGPLYLRLTATCIGRDLGTLLGLLADAVLRPRFDPGSIGPARDLCAQSLAALRDNPQDRAGVLLTERHVDPPLNRSGLGTAEGLAAITRDDLAQRWERCARPVGSILAIAGDVDHAHGAAHLDALLRGWSGSAEAVPVTPSPTRGTMFHQPDDTSQVQILLAHAAPPEPAPESRLERLAAAVLSGGPAARLFCEVRERRGLCYAVSAAYAADKSHGRVVAYVGTTPEKAQRSIDVLTAELRRLRTPEGRVSVEEFHRAGTGLRTSLVFSGESTAARAMALALDMHRLGRPRSLAEIADGYAAITLDQLNDHLAARPLGELTCVTLGPTPLVRPAD
ncbi:MAG: peptidase M16 [Planctomyces sp.]|nr:peptidase M16 [Planctomyces sp.]MBA4039287.1 peptidase M16 [Planctomyces sp.]